MTGKVSGKFPAIFGHEASGVVESVGDEVTRLHTGDHVLLIFLPHCGNCRVCKAGIKNSCLKFLTVETSGLMSDGTSRVTCRGQSIFNFIGISSFAEYTVVSVDNCVLVNHDAPLDKICLLSCAIPTGYGAVVNSATVREGSTCAVFGLGAIGLATIMGCRAMKAGQIIGVDINPEKFEIAKQLGATECINPKDLTVPIDVYFKQNFLGGVDFSFECIGLVETMKQAYDSITFGHGVCVLIGIAPSGKNLDISPIEMQLGKSIVGSWYGGYKIHDIPALVEKYLDGSLDLDSFITHNMKFDEINKAIDYLKCGKCVRTVINF